MLDSGVLIDERHEIEQLLGTGGIVRGLRRPTPTALASRRADSASPITIPTATAPEEMRARSRV